MTTVRTNTDQTAEPAVERDATAAWAETFMRQLAAEPLPLYGSAAFGAAPGPVRLASAIRAAEAWRRDRDPHVLAARLDLELQAAWRAVEADYEAWRTLAARVRATAGEPTFDELQRRRAS